MRIRRRRSALLSTALLVAVLTLPIGDTTFLTFLTAQSPGSSISSTSGPVQWDFQPVIAGQVTNLGVQDVCPPGLCDNHDLVVALPAPAATFYTTNTAKLTIKYTWSSSAPTDIDKSKDAGTPFGIQNAEFAEVIAGDDDRAAFAFLGTPTAGDTQASDFLGVWHMYVAFTYDGGRLWTTADATPSDPVQRGCIWNQGGSNPCRNLLDFNDITVDKTGRVLVGYADGCTGSCVTDPSENASTGPATAQDALATIARQVGGRGLFKVFDGTQFGTRTGDLKGGGTLCYGDPAAGVQGDPGCK
jgi:hypothetical protein